MCFFFVDFQCSRLKTDMFGFAAEPIEVTSWLVRLSDFSSRVARGANERVSAANE